MNNDIEIRIDDDRNIDVDMSNELIEKVVVQADWNENDQTKDGYIKNKPALSNVATSGDYEDLSNKPTIPTKTSDLTNDSDFVDSNYVNGKIDDLKWELGANDLSLQTDTTVAYTKTVPTGAIGCQINKLGFMSYKTTNLCPIANTTVYPTRKYIANIPNFTSGDYTFHIYNESDEERRVFLLGYNGQSYVRDINNFYVPANSDLFITFTLSNDDNSINAIGLYNQTTTIYKQIGLYKGTITTYQPYFEGIRDSAITSIKSYDSNNNLIDTYTIPSEIQALEGYGRGINSTVYNNVDFASGKYIKKVGKIVLNKTDYNWTLNATNTIYFLDVIGNEIKKEANNDSINNLICDKLNTVSWNNLRNSVVNTGIGINNQTGGYIGISVSDYANLDTITIYYELATPLETSISEQAPLLEVEAGGYIVFENEFGQAVPSDITYLIEVAK